MASPVDYTSKDFDGLKAEMLAYAATNFPQWTSRSEADFGMLMVELFAYMGDVLGYYGDRAADEAFIMTATQRNSLLAHAAMLGYTPGSVVPSTGTVTVAAPGSSNITVAKGTPFITGYVAAIDGPIVFEASASVTALAGGATISVPVTQGTTQGSTVLVLHPGTTGEQRVSTENVGATSGSPNQAFTLANSPVILNSVRVFMNNSTTGTSEPFEEWTYYANILEAAPDARAFTLSTDQHLITQVVFGDGHSGYLPSAGGAVYVAYRVGGGTYGNIGANLVTDIGTSIPGLVLSASSAMIGGADVESNDSIRTNATKAYRSQDRAVTTTDFHNLAVAVPGVSKAKAVAGTPTNVSLFLMGPGGVVPTQPVIDATQRYIDARKMIGTTVLCLQATPIGIILGTSVNPILIGVSPFYNQAAVLAQATLAAQAFLAPDNVDIGVRLSMSTLFMSLASIPGVSYVNLPIVYRADGVANTLGTTPPDILLRDWEFPYVSALWITATGGIG